MTVAFPWSGRDVNALVPMSGRAAVPNTPAGTGFNWPSLVGRISGYVRPVRGWGLSGLGQSEVPSSLPGTDLTTTPTDGVFYDVTTGLPTTLYSNPTVNSLSAGGVSSSSSQAPWWGSILASSLTSGLRTGSQIASYQLNPLYQKSTFYQTPQGAIYASNIPTGSVIPGLTTGTGSSLLPILLIGGVMVMFMAMRK